MSEELTRVEAGILRLVLEIYRDEINDNNSLRNLEQKLARMYADEERDDSDMQIFDLVTR